MTQSANDIPMAAMKIACDPLPDPQPESRLLHAQVSNIICIL
ncbi:hypothetical protein [Rhizobium sp. ICMP 5592]|nr:hypothetical protein [Rhizobium sp. ICMP 5592]